MNKPKSPFLPTEPTEPKPPKEFNSSTNRKETFEIEISSFDLTWQIKYFTLDSFNDFILKKFKENYFKYKNYKYKSFEVIENSIKFSFEKKSSYDHEEEFYVKILADFNVEITDKELAEELKEYEKQLKRYNKNKSDYDQKYEKYLKLKEQYNIDHKVYLEELRIYEILQLEKRLKKLKKEI